MSIISVSNLTFAYEGALDNIFENVSFNLDTDWRLGFTGRNGRGKTTFLKLLTGEYDYTGKISAAGFDFEYFPYEVADKSADTIRVIDDVCGNYQNWELVRELSLLGVDEDVLGRPFCTLSNGERTKVLLAALFLKENSFLLIDEPTNHLDMEARSLVCEYLKTKKGFILVSHDRALLDGCTDHTLAINKTGVEIQKGNFSSWLANKEKQDSFELLQNEKLKKDIKRLSAAAKRASDWSDKTEKTKYATKNSGLAPDRGYVGHKSAKMMKRSKSIEARKKTAAEEKSGLLKNIESAEDIKISQISYHKGRLAAFDKVSILYGEKAVCKDVSFVVEQGDRIALYGKNGSGKSSVIKLLCGEDIAYTGNFQKGSGLKISYVAQDASFLSGSLSEYAYEKDISETLLKAILRKLDFSRQQFEKDMRDFSGGQKKKVLLAASLCEKSHLLVWDEPLNFVDVISRIQIEKLLLEYKPTILFVEHDRTFCDKISTTKIMLN